VASALAWKSSVDIKHRVHLLDRERAIGKLALHEGPNQQSVVFPQIVYLLIGQERDDFLRDE
jgi:hypothetical protein